MTKLTLRLDEDLIVRAEQYAKRTGKTLSQVEDFDRVREKIRAGLSSLDRGEGIPGELVFAKLEARLAENTT